MTKLVKIWIFTKVQLIHQFNFVLEETETKIVVVEIPEDHLPTNLQQVFNFSKMAPYLKENMRLDDLF